MKRSARPVCVIGAGHSGVACMLALLQLGWRVNGCDVNADRYGRLAAGSSRRQSAWIVDSLSGHRLAGHLHLFDEIETAASEAGVVIVAVETHVRGDGSTDLSELHATFRALAATGFSSWPTIVIRSTVPPGTVDRFAQLVSDWANLLYAPAVRSDVCAVTEFLHPEKIMVGCVRDSQAVPYLHLLEDVARPIFLSSRRNVELIVCCASAYMAVNASFASEVASLCERYGATSDDVLRGVAYFRSEAHLRPGMALDSPAFDREARRLQNAATQRGVKQELLAATLCVSEEQPQNVVARLEVAIGSIAGICVGIWGVTAAASIDDPRDAPAYRVIELLAERGARTIVFDPALQVAALPHGCRLAKSALEAAHADALLVLSPCADFYGIDPLLYAATVARSVVVDAGNILDGERVEASGMIYHRMGSVQSNWHDRPHTLWHKSI